MKKTRLAAFAAVALAGTVALPGTAFAAATQYTIHETFTDGPFADVNPCTGGTGLFSSTGSIVFHETLNAGGGGAFTGTVTGKFRFVGDDSADSASGRFTGWFGGTFNARGVIQEGGTFNVTGRGDRTRLVLTEVGHVTIGSDGTIHVEFGRQTLHCN